MILDIDECYGGNSGCTHGCLNTNGSFQCLCPEGRVNLKLKLGDDQQTCGGESNK